MDKLVSVIIIAYNIEQYIEKCLDSVLNQTYTNLEIMVVDDASTDKTRQICDEYVGKDSRVKVIHLSKNEGAANARNLAIENTNGEYLTFIDGDDWVNDNYVEEFLDLAEKNNAEAVIGPYYRFSDKEGMFYFYDAGYSTGELKLDDYLRERTLKKVAWYTTAWGKLYHRRLFNEKLYGADYFPSDVIMGEDQLIIHRLCLRANRIWYDQNACYCWRIRENSITQASMTVKKASDYLEGEIQYLVDLMTIGKLNNTAVRAFQNNINLVKSDLEGQGLQNSGVYHKIYQLLVLGTRGK